MFSKPRLEGRALEHALAGDGGVAIRMKDREFQPVCTPEAKQIRRYMDNRVAELRTAMEPQGLYLGPADCPVKLAAGDHISVDVLVWSSAHQGNILTEVKWTRRSQAAALKWGKQSLPKLRAARSGGTWLRSRKEVKAVGTGVLVVRPADWYLELTALGKSVIKYPKAMLTTKKRASGRSLPGNQKRRTNAHLEALDKEWRRTRGREMGNRHQRKYRQTKKNAK